MEAMKMQTPPPILWAAKGCGRGNLSHYQDVIRSKATGLRYSYCGRVIEYTGDDGTCPSNEPCECKACNKLVLKDTWRFSK